MTFELEDWVRIRGKLGRVVAARGGRLQIHLVGEKEPRWFDPYEATHWQGPIEDAHEPQEEDLT